MRSLYWLVRLPLKAGSHASAPERSNIVSTSQALRLANLNVSNRNSINRTALHVFILTVKLCLFAKNIKGFNFHLIKKKVSCLHLIIRKNKILEEK